jgi:peptidoglycan/LPS O-acetylase OafA/YrhL
VDVNQGRGPSNPELVGLDATEQRRLNFQHVGTVARIRTTVRIWQRAVTAMRVSSNTCDSGLMRRVHFLDGLRGFAALFVVTYHTGCAFLPAMTIGGTSPVHTPIDHFLRYAPILGLPFKGNSAVSVFFALSGVALCLGPLRKSDRLSAVTAAIRRAPRLMIPALSATLLSALLWVSGAYRNMQAVKPSGNRWLSQFWHADPTAWGPLREGSAGVVDRHVPHSYVPVLWTMPWEFLGSLLVFAVLILMPPRAIRFAFYIVAAIYWRHSYLLDFVAGMAACDVWLMTGPAVRRRGRIVAYVVGVYALVLLSCPTPSGNGLLFYRWLLPPTFPFTGFDIAEQDHLVGAALAVAALLALVPAQNALSTRPARFLGRVSFSLYLVHFLVLGSLGCAVFIALYGHVPYAVDVSLTAALVIAVSLALAFVFTVAVDEPAVRQLSRLSNLVPRLVLRRRHSEKASDCADQRALHQNREDHHHHDDAEEPVLQSVDPAVHGIQHRGEQDRNGALQASEDDEESFIRR